MGDIDTKWCENKLCSNKDAGRTLFCGTEEKWWHIPSHMEFVKTEVCAESENILFGVLFQQQRLAGGPWRLERAEGEGSHPKEESSGSSACSHHKFLKASLLFHTPSACCELSLKYLLLTCGISPWCSFSREKSCPSVFRKLGIRIWFLLEILG